MCVLGVIVADGAKVAHDVAHAQTKCRSREGCRRVHMLPNTVVNMINSTEKAARAHDDAFSLSIQMVR